MTKQPKFALLCPKCKKPVLFKREDSVQKWYICSNNHETAEGCLIKQEIDGIIEFGLKFLEQLEKYPEVIEQYEKKKMDVKP